MSSTFLRNFRFISAAIVAGVFTAATLIVQHGASKRAPEISPPAPGSLPRAGLSTTTNISAAPAIVAPQESATPSPELEDRSLTVESIQSLAARDPQRALSIAFAESDPALRDELLQAALRGWAGTDADAAAAWARSQSYLDTGLAMAAVFNGTSRNPEKGVQLYQRLSAEDADNASSYGGYLIFALGKTEHFELAANVAAAGAAEFRTDLLTAAYRTWAAHEPKKALAAAMELKDPDAQRAAFQATIGGWADVNPRELTELAITLPEGPDRKLALTTALRNWIEKDPAAAAEWAAHTKPFPEMEATLEE